MPSTINRRKFIQLSSVAAAGTMVAPLGLLNSRMADAAESCNLASFAVNGFGPINPTLPENTLMLASHPRGDLSNTPLLRLPQGFRYSAVSIVGTPMSDGVLTPGDHDGMACFQGRRGDVILVRNHELSPTENKYGNNLGCLAPNGKQYDPFTGSAAGLGGGGTSTVVINRHGQVTQDYISLGGTIRNCAGGPTPWNSWISCEEDTSLPGSTNTKKHGYCFEVPSQLGEAVDPIPLTAMGRCNHEAVSVDSKDGYVYLTEDRGDSCYYRYVPRKKSHCFGNLQDNDGDLYAMVIEAGQVAHCDGVSLVPVANYQNADLVDTRGVRRGAPASMLPFLGQPLKVRWVKLEDVDPEQDTLRQEAQAKGAAVFYRGEGAWFHQGKHYFVCSGAGEAGEGQVYCYDPKRETITLIVESTDENLLDGPDNMTVARDGTLYLCEDGSGGSEGDANYSQYVVGVDASGGLFQFAHNIIPGDTSEFAGACFSPDGRFMFVNNQGMGITYCIWREDHRPIYLETGYSRRPGHGRGRGRYGF